MKKIFLFFLIFWNIQFLKASSMEGLFGINFADKLEISGLSDRSSDPAALFGFSYSRDLFNKFSVQSYALLETPRDVGGNAKLGFISLGVNLKYKIHEISYVFAGLHLPVFIYEDKNLGNIDPKLAVTIGSGYEVTPKMNVEIFFKTTQFKISNRDTDLWGFGLLLSYKFKEFSRK